MTGGAGELGSSQIQLAGGQVGQRRAVGDQRDSAVPLGRRRSGGVGARDA